MLLMSVYYVPHIWSINCVQMTQQEQATVWEDDFICAVLALPPGCSFSSLENLSFNGMWNVAI